MSPAVFVLCIMADHFFRWRREKKHNSERLRSPRAWSYVNYESGWEYTASCFYFALHHTLVAHFRQHVIQFFCEMAIPHSAQSVINKYRTE